MFVDLVFLGDICNLDCVYCSAGQTAWKQIGQVIDAQRPDASDPMGQQTRTELSALRERLLRIIEACAGGGVTGLKLSGGEIFTQPSLAVDIIDAACRQIEFVQVLTNGLRVGELIELLETHPNLYVQLSLDGFDEETNRARTRLAAHTTRIVANAQRIAERYPLELNMVLTRWNTPRLPGILDRVRELGRDVIAYPFPVRGDAVPSARSTSTPGPFLPDRTLVERLAPSDDDLRGLDQVIDGYARWADVLPPLTYLNALRDFYRRGNTNGDCRVPRAIAGVDQDGRQAVCACGDLGLLGEIEDGLSDLPDGPVWGPPCAGCFTHYEIVHHATDPAAVRGPFTRALVESIRAGAGRPPTA